MAMSVKERTTLLADAKLEATTGVGVALEVLGAIAVKVAMSR